MTGALNQNDKRSALMAFRFFLFYYLFPSSNPTGDGRTFIIQNGLGALMPTNLQCGWHFLSCRLTDCGRSIPSSSSFRLFVNFIHFQFQLREVQFSHKVCGVLLDVQTRSQPSQRTLHCIRSWNLNKFTFHVDENETENLNWPFAFHSDENHFSQVSPKFIPISKRNLIVIHRASEIRSGLANGLFFDWLTAHACTACNRTQETRIKFT